MTEVTGCRPAVVTFHRVGSTVQINLMDYIIDSGFPIVDPFYAVSPASLEEEETIFYFMVGLGYSI